MKRDKEYCYFAAILPQRQKKSTWYKFSVQHQGASNYWLPSLGKSSKVTLPCNVLVAKFQVLYNKNILHFSQLLINKSYFYGPIISCYM